jgi:hypothetical protein
LFCFSPTLFIKHKFFVDFFHFSPFRFVSKYAQFHFAKSKCCSLEKCRYAVRLLVDSLIM